MATAGLNTKLLLRVRKAADITYPITTAIARPPATTAAKVNTLRLYLSARAKKNDMINAPSSSTNATTQNLPSPIAEMAGISYAVSPPARWKALNMSQPSHAPIISAIMYIIPRITEMRRDAIIPTVMIGLRQEPEKAYTAISTAITAKLYVAILAMPINDSENNKSAMSIVPMISPSKAP